MCVLCGTQDIKRRYPTVMDLYSGSGHLAKQLESELGTTKCIMVDAAGPSVLSTGSGVDISLTGGDCMSTERMLYRDADDEFDGAWLEIGA